MERRVEILTAKLSSDGYKLYSGDRVTIPDELAKKWCNRGWAEDMTGEYSTGQSPNPSNVELKIDNNSQKPQSEVK